MFWFWFILFLFVCFWFFYNPQPYYTEIRFGRKGAGKTCDLCKESIKAQKKGMKVYSNIEIPGNYVFNPRDMKDFTFEPNSLVLIDEVGLVFDNRNWKAFDSGFNVFFKYSRQYRLRIIMYSQAYNDIDLKIRLLFDKLSLMTRIGKVTLIRPIYKKVGIATDINGNGQIVDTYSFAWVFDWRLTYMPRYYGLFKSFNPPARELIRSTYEDYNEIQAVYKSIKTYILFKVKVLLDKCKTNIKRVHSHFSKKVEESIYID